MARDAGHKRQCKWLLLLVHFISISQSNVRSAAYPRAFLVPRPTPFSSISYFVFTLISLFLSLFLSYIYVRSLSEGEHTVFADSFFSF